VHLYFRRRDLQSEFAELHDEQVRAAFAQWLRRHRYQLELSLEQVSLFAEFAASCSGLLERAALLYRDKGRKDAADRPVVNDPNAERPVNLAGFVTAPTGMGESARSMAATLQQAGVSPCTMTLPHLLSERQHVPAGPAFFGWPASNAGLSITVANADCAELLESFLPSSFWGERNVGYWVWETEQLPSRFRRAQQPFDEIWTPSAYSAAAIRRTVQKPVHVLPHTVDMKAVDAARADRRRFGLPEDAVLFGFAFDPASVLERKNVLGLIEAFDLAFRADDRCYLLLKINAAGRRSYEFQEALARVENDRVLLLESVLDRNATFSLLKSLDAYVSLHRAEGFGLTCAEAMACGLPVIASNYSGNLEFMSTDNSLLVPVRVIETERPYGPYPAGTRWGDPDRDAAVAALRQLLDVERRRHYSHRGHADVHRTLGVDTVARRLAQLLEPARAACRTDPACV
jgi:glycosyltransferase involved in cell wall biosynthesis